MKHLSLISSPWWPISRWPRPNRSALWLQVGLESRRIVFVSLGAVIAALGYSLFQVPYQIAAGGVAGAGIIINHFSGWPVGVIYLILNVPLLILGYLHLGRWPFVLRTLVGVLVFSVATDLFITYLPAMLETYPLTHDVLLGAIYGGLVGGIGNGLVYRLGSTLGGTTIPGRIIQQRTGIPLSQVYLYTDGTIVLTAGIVFGWELALYALLALFLSGMASDYIMEGVSNVRTVTIITNSPEALSQALMVELGRGVSRWEVVGSYTGQTHTMLTCTLYRPQVHDLKRIISQVDPTAFVTIGVAHQALGLGFNPLKR